MILKPTFKTLFLLLGFGIFLSCSSDDGPGATPTDQPQLVLTASAMETAVGEEITFQVTVNGEAVSGAEIFIDGTGISGYSYVFEDAGDYQVMAKKEGYQDSEPVDINVKEVQVDVYVAGFQNNSSGVRVAMYWKNGEAMPLTNGIEDAEAYSVFVSDGDVYVAGYEGDYPNVVAKYWKNGTPMALSEGATPAYAESIFVEGNDVYVAGYEKNSSGTNVAKYWNLPAGEAGTGTPISLTNGSQNAAAYSIFVYDGDAYVAGHEYSTAKYWVNGVPVNLTDGVNDAEANSIFVTDGTVYVAGNIYNGTFDNATYWALPVGETGNGTAVNLGNGANTTSAESIFVSDGDVHVVGYETSYVAKYWKNGVSTNLSPDDGEYYAESIVVSDGDIYVAGSEYDSGYIAKYWYLPAGEEENKEVINLTDGTTNAEAYSIFVTKTIVE